MRMLANETVTLRRRREWSELGFCLAIAEQAAVLKQTSKFGQLSVFSEFQGLVKVAKECVRCEFSYTCP